MQFEWYLENNFVDLVNFCGYINFNINIGDEYTVSL